MNTKLLLAAIITAVVNFLLGWLFYGFLLPDFYAAHTIHYEGLEKMPPNLLGIFISGFVYSLFLSTVFYKIGNIRNFIEGAKNGIWIGLLIGLSIDLSFWSTMNLIDEFVLVTDVLVSAVMGLISGGIIGWILGYSKAE